MSNVTPWFINGEIPFHPGVYNVSCQKQDQSGDWWSRWDGKTWYHAYQKFNDAKKCERPAQTKYWWHIQGSWRGLAQPSKG